MKKKLTALALVIVMVAMLFTGLTMAYFTDNEEVTNVFTVGSIEIDVYEHDIDDPSKEVEENFYKDVVPGKPYPKDPTIENVGDNDAYARMKVTVPLDVFNAISKVEGADLSKIFNGYDENLWDRVQIVEDTDNNTVTYVYNYANEETEGILKADAKAKLFTEFKLPEKLTQEVMADWDAFYIKVVGEAIQAEGFDSAEAAFKALDEVAAPIEGTEVVITLEELQAKLDAATGTTNITLAGDIVGDVTVTQKPDVKITIDGAGHEFAGVIIVDGKSATYTTAGLTIKDMVFKADSISADACIRLGDGTNATRYTCNVTVDGCTFDVPGAVGVKSYTGGDKNLTITSCTATANCHSLVQAKGIDGVLVENCKVYSKNGLNFNNSDNVTVSGCTVDTKGYAARFGESSGGVGAAETYLIKDSTLKSANDDGDAVIILRGTADNSTLTIVNTTITGTPDIVNTATGATVVK